MDFADDCVVKEEYTMLYYMVANAPPIEQSRFFREYNANRLEPIMEVQSLGMSSTNLSAGPEEMSNTGFQDDMQPDIYDQTNADEFATVAKFLAKPFRVGTFPWAATDGINIDVVNIPNLFTVVSGVPAWVEKLRGFQGINATLCFKFLINTGPFSAGRLRAAYYPAGNDNLRKATIHFSNRIPHSQLPGVDIDAEKPVSELRIPYKTQLQYYQLTESSVSWGSLRLKVMAPYRTGVDNAQSVTVTAWAWLEDVKLFGQTHSGLVTQSSNFETQSNEMPDKKVPSEEESRPLSSFFGGVTTSLRALSSIPSLKPFLGTPMWVTNALSQTAFSLGWSKPNLAMKYTRNSVGTLQNMANSDGERAGNSLAMLSDAKLAPIDDLARFDEDETSVNFIKSQLSFWRGYSITTAQASGALLFESFMGPDAFTELVSVTENYLTPVAYIGNYFEFYRGGFDIEMHIKKTVYHRGQIAITWQPGPSIDASLDASTYLYREIIDLETTNIVKFSVPYYNGYEYLPTITPCGRLQVRLVNPLQAPDTVNNTVDVLVYIKGNESLQFMRPKAPRYSCPFVTQSLPLSTTNEIGPIGGSKPNDFNIGSSARCGSELVTSLLQFAKRHHSINLALPGVTFPATATFNPWLLTCDGTGADPLLNNARYLGSLAAPYAFMRGGIELNETDLTVGSYVQEAELVSNRPVQWQWDAPNSIIDAVTYANNINGGLLIEIPYYNTVRASPIRYAITPYAGSAFDGPRGQIRIPANSTTRLTRAVADDFQFLFFVGIPRMKDGI